MAHLFGNAKQTCLMKISPMPNFQKIGWQPQLHPKEYHLCLRHSPHPLLLKGAVMHARTHETK